MLLSIFLLTACSGASLQEESKETSKTVKTMFDEKGKKPNKKSGNIRVYLPFGFEIQDETANNIILKNGSKTYILFVNPQEESSSEVVYQATVDQYKNLDTNEKFTKGDKFGFLTIKQLEDDMNELTVGIGGTKITTQTKTTSLNEEAKAMMQIVNSVTFEK